MVAGRGAERTETDGESAAGDRSIASEQGERRARPARERRGLGLAEAGCVYTYVYVRRTLAGVSDREHATSLCLCVPWDLKPGF